MSPAATCEPTPGTAAPDASPLPHILVVEDDPSIGTMIEEMLAGKHYDVRLETGPADALRAVEQREPDLVLMDINLGADIDGIETIHRMRKTTDVPVCFITALSDDATIARAEAVSPMAYLVKPFEMGDIAAMVKISLAGAPRLKEKIRQAACLAPASTPRDALLVLAADGSLESASPAALQLLAWSSGDGTAASPLHTRLRLSAYEQPGDPAEAESVLRSLLQTAQSGSAPCWRGWYHPASGSPIPLLIAAKPAADRRELQLRKIPAAALRLGKNAGVAPGAAKSPAPSGALAEADSEDALTGLPNRDAILSRLDHLESTGLSLFVLFPEHTSVLRQRFGSGAIDRIFLSYTQHLAQHLPAECQLARWDAISFVVLPKPEAGLEMEREISRVLSSPMLYHLQLAGRSALLRVTCAYSICKPGAGGPLADQIETLVADHGRR